MLFLLRNGSHYQVIRYTEGDAEAEVVDSFSDDRFGSSVRYAKHVNGSPLSELSPREAAHRGCIPVMLP